MAQQGKMGQMPRYLKAVLIGLAAFVASCAGPETVKDAGKLVGEFHDQYNASNYGAVWSGASDDLRDTTSQQQFAAMLASIRERMGKVVSTKQVGWASNFNNGDSFVTIKMQTTFEKGTGDEEFVYRKAGDDLNLAGYHINWNIAPPGVRPGFSATETKST